MPTNDEWRQILGERLTDAEVAEFAAGVRTLVAQFLDDYFRDEFEPDGV